MDIVRRVQGGQRRATVPAEIVELLELLGLNQVPDQNLGNLAFAVPIDGFPSHPDVQVIHGRFAAVGGGEDVVAALEV